MLQDFFKKSVGFFVLLFSACFPVSVFALEVSPAATDVSFSDVSQDVSQIFSAKNTADVPQTYEARVQLVTFAADGSIANLAEIPDALDVHVFPEIGTILPQKEQSFEVIFHHPERVTTDQAFAFVLYEKNDVSQQLSAGFVAFLFPVDFVGQALPFFRIDAFSVQRSDAGWEVIAQFTNTGDSLVRPASMIVVKDAWGHEILRTLFADHEGRLPAGTTRVISDVLPFTDFGTWHVGGNVTFSLLSVDKSGGEVQQASVALFTWPGKGVLALGLIGIVFFVGVLLIFLKRRGILRA